MSVVVVVVVVVVKTEIVSRPRKYTSSGYHVCMKCIWPTVTHRIHFIRYIIANAIVMRFRVANDPVFSQLSIEIIVRYTTPHIRR